MDKAFHFLADNLYRYMIPICLLCVYRIIVCFLELGRIKTLREKKGIFRSMRSQYTEIGTFTLALVGGVFTCLVPKVWYFLIPLMFVLGYIGFRIGRSKGTEMDNIYREVALEMKKMETEELDGRPEQPALHGVAGFMDSFAGDDENTDKTAQAENTTAPTADDE